MIKTENYIIVEIEDIVAACEHAETVTPYMEKMLRELNGDGMGEQDAMAYKADMDIVMIAAGIGAAACKRQGGIAIMRNGASQEEKRQAAIALEEARAKRAAGNSAPVQ